MKKLRFLIAIVLIFSLLPIFSVSAADAADEVKVIETNEFKKLEAFGLVDEDDTLLYYDNVMRSSFIAHIMKCYPGYSNAISTATFENPFSDVGEALAEANAIAAAAKIGLISGVKGSAFRPFDPITKSEAAKIFVTMLGYTPYAERTGGYPSGYLAMAQSLGIFDGCEFTEEGYFTVKDFLRAYGNVLDTEALEVRSITLNAKGEFVTHSYKALEERTLLYHTFGIFEAKGIVEADEYTAITGKSKLSSGQVKINGYTYDAKDTNASLFIGYNTHYYYKQDKNAKRGQLVYIEAYKNNVINTHSNLIEPRKVSKTNFGYYKDETDSRCNDVDLSKALSLVINGEQTAFTSPALLQPANGTVTLIDNNDDRVYDVAFVMDYRTILVATASVGTYQIIDAFGGTSITLDPNAKEYGVTLDIEQPVTDNTRYYPSYGLYGSYIPFVENDFSEIKSGDIILYAESKTNNRNIKFVKVSKTSVEGTVSSIVDGLVQINGKKYQVGPIMVEEAKKDAQGNITGYTIKKKTDFKVVLGEYGIYYLDAFGNIVNKSIARDVAYGFLNGINRETDAFSPVVRAQIFTENGNWVVLELADKVKTNIAGDVTAFSSLTAETVYNNLKNNPQLITYTVNKDGKINNISIAQNVDAYSADEKKAIDNDLFRKVKYYTSDTERYQATPKLMAYEILVDESTKFFAIPGESGGNMEDFYMESVVFLEEDYLGTYHVYDVSEERLAGAIVFVGRSPKVIPGKTNMLIVEETITTATDNGDIRAGITGLYGGQPITLVTAEGCVYNERNYASVTSPLPSEGPLAKGDIVFVATNSKGEVTVVERVCMASKCTPGNLTITYKQSAGGGSFGIGASSIYAVNALKNKIVLDITENQKGIIGVNTSSKFYVYDSQKGTITEGSFADVEKGGIVFVKLTSNNVKEMLIYR